MPILVINSEGPGAVIGTQLERAGHCVKFLDRTRRAGALFFRPLVVRSAHGSYKGFPRVVEDAELFGPDDLIILAGDAADIPALTEVLPRAVGPSTIILSLVNGFEHLDTLKNACPAARVLDGQHDIAVTIDEYGAVIHNAIGGDKITISARDPDEISTARSVAAFFADTDLIVRLSGSVERLRWERMVRVCGVVGLAALMQTSMDRLGKADPDDHHLWGIIQECAEVAEASGHPINVGELSALMEGLPSSMPALIGAMLNRVERGDTREIAALVEQMVRAARAANVATPILDLVASALAAREMGARNDVDYAVPPPRPAPKPRRDGWFSRQWYARPAGGRR